MLSVAAMDSRGFSILVTSAHAALNNTVPTLSQGTDLLLQPGRPQEAPSFLISNDREDHKLAVHTEGSEDKWLVLGGPSGKGEHQLQIAASLEPFGIGYSIQGDSWNILEKPEGHFSLVCTDKDMDEGYWVAVPEPLEAEEAWSIWWLQPSPANVEDMVEAVKIDVKLVPKSGE